MPIAAARFCTGALNLTYPLGVLTGACRSGKTLLGNLLATCREVEYADEPYTGMLLPMAAHTGQVEPGFASAWLSTYFTELFHDLVILRRANFRPHDLSSIWSKKTPQEIFERLNGLRTRDEVGAFVAANNCSLVVALSETAPFMDIVWAAVPQAKVIHVVRNGFDVAADVHAKAWFSDDRLQRPTLAQMFTPMNWRNGTWYVPWWVDSGDEVPFLGLSEQDRSAYYWCSMIEKGTAMLESAGATRRVLLVRHRDVVRDPGGELDRAAEFLGVTRGPMTNQKLEEVAQRSSSAFAAQLSPALRERVDALNRSLEG